MHDGYHSKPRLGQLHLAGYDGGRVAAGGLDCRPGRASGATFDKLFAIELYSNRAVLEATSWRPRLRLEDMAGAIMGSGEHRQ